jgi:CheY-like chemotaxis protein
MKKILLLDDDNIFIANIKALLDPKKYEVVFATNGVDGLKALDTFTPDAILLDINMPMMNGFEFLKQANEKYGRGKIPVLITSNLEGMDKISEGVELGIRGYVVKSGESLESLELSIENLFKEEKKHEGH